jgi:L,D-peptidoglycan transpeptidase YkuD (ErfK/YbiS/YcfS/YnhG family)
MHSLLISCGQQEKSARIADRSISLSTFMPSDQTRLTQVSAPRQLLLVVAEHWTSSSGQLQRFARESADGKWLRVGKQVAVSLGRSGLAWGRGLHPPVGGVGPEKREGDGRAPVGVFAISALFGTAGAESDLARAAKLPYLCATRDLKAIDDPASAYYNQIVDQSAIARHDWVSCEDMLRGDGRYAAGAVVGHNCDPVVPGAGSCIFLHVWQAPGMPTAGCTAMALADMSEIAGWLDGAAAPLLVQLPQAEYERWRADWGLPVFAP